MKKYVVVDIGCIECGVSSKIVGVFASDEKAREVAKACQEKYDFREGGQNSFEVFLLPDIDVIDPEYEI